MDTVRFIRLHFTADVTALTLCLIPTMNLASSTPTSTLTWISWFCSLPGHEYFCEVTEDFIEDDFNLTGLNGMVPFWKEAMEMVLDVEPGAYLNADSCSYDVVEQEHQTRTLPRFQMYQLLNRRRNCFTGLCTNDLYLPALDCKRWYGSFPSTTQMLGIKVYLG